MKPLRLIAQSVGCQGNVFRLTRGLRMYADDSDDHFPPAERWMDRGFFYIDRERYLHCPAVSQEGQRQFGYAMNTKAAGRARAKIEEPDETALVYDSTNTERSAADAFATLPVPGRHVTRPRKGVPSRRGNFVGYVGGNARIRLDDQVKAQSGAAP